MSGRVHAPENGRNWLLVAVAAVAAAAGCGQQSKQLPVYPVRGTVTVGGKPAAGVRVWLWPATVPPHLDAYCPSGETDAAGVFTLSTYRAGDGAPEGEYAITAEWPVRFNVVKNQHEGDRLNGRYRDAGKSPLRATVPPRPTDLAVVRLDP